MPLYSAKAAGATTSDLYTLDSGTAANTSIGAIGYAVTGLAFDPTDDTLYGVTSANSSAAPEHLITIDVSTGDGTDVGALGTTISDIAFDDTGVLYGWTGKFATPESDLVTINTSSGAISTIGDSGLGGNGGALSFHSDGTLYVMMNISGGAHLYTCNPGTGAVTSLGELTAFSGGIPGSMAFDTADIIWWLNGGGATPVLQTADPDTLVRATIGTAGANFDALAWSGVGGGGGGDMGAQPEGVSIAFSDPVLEPAPTWTRIDV